MFPRNIEYRQYLLQKWTIIVGQRRLTTGWEPEGTRGVRWGRRVSRSTRTGWSCPRNCTTPAWTAEKPKISHTKSSGTPKRECSRQSFAVPHYVKKNKFSGKGHQYAAVRYVWWENGNCLVVEMMRQEKCAIEIFWLPPEVCSNFLTRRPQGSGWIITFALHCNTSYFEWWKIQNIRSIFRLDLI